MTSDLRALAERAARETTVCPARREEIAKSIRRHAQPCWACDGSGAIKPTAPEIADAIERVARQAVEDEREKLAEKIAELKRRNEILADRKDDYFVALYQIKTFVGNIGDCIEIARKALEIKPVTHMLDDKQIEHVRKLFLVDYRASEANTDSIAAADAPTKP